MAGLGILEVGTVIQLIITCKDKVETVLSNRTACYDLAENLAIIHDILRDLKPDQKANSEKATTQRVLNKLVNITDRATVLFDKCQSGRMTMRIRNFLFPTPIRDELEKLRAEIQIMIGMFQLVFQVEQNAAGTRGGIHTSPIDESMFDQMVEEDTTTADDYLDD